MTDTSPSFRTTTQAPLDPEPWGPADTLPPSPPPAPIEPTPPRKPAHRGHRASIVLTTGVLAFGAAWVAAGWLGADVTTEITDDFDAVAITTANTPVEVRYADVTTARIVEHRRRGSDRLEQHVTNGQLTMNYRSSGFVFGPSQERLELVLPAAMAGDTPDMRVRTSNGTIIVEGDFGTTDVTTTTGRIGAVGSFDSLRAKATTGSVDVAGKAVNVRAETSTGSVNMGIEDAAVVQAKTTTGSIDIEANGRQPETVEARASTGSVDVDVPDGRYAVHAQTGTGSTDVHVINDPAAPNRVHAETSTGSIDVF